MDPSEMVKQDLLANENVESAECYYDEEDDFVYCEVEQKPQTNLEVDDIEDTMINANKERATVEAVDDGKLLLNFLDEKGI